jgi:predicted ArsR family transcriptional regulator
MAERVRAWESTASATPAASSPGRREEVLRALRAAQGPQSIATLAAGLRLHPNTVRFHLDSLIAAGRVRHADGGPRRPGRPALLYEAVRGMDPGGPRRYQTLAEILVMGLAAVPDADSLAAAAGRQWGRRQAAGCTEGPVLDRLVTMLADLGFAPERSDCGDDQRIGLRHCPFLELAESHAEIVCPIHLGLMQGAMEAWGASRTIGRLDQFSEPDLCVAHLTPID